MANLNEMTNEQLDAYREQTAKILDIDPLMLDFIWMDNPDTGLRNRVLYARRGAAEILRKQLGISVTNLVLHESDGWVAFTATGVDKTGRQEIAVGSAYIDGLKGDKKAHAIMTSQTRAVRRLTLQFVTGGVLDETEVQAQTAVTLPTAASGALLQGSPTVIPPMPTVAPSAAPGKDITIGPDSMGNMTRASVPEAILPKTDMSPEAMEKFSAQQQALRDEAKQQLDAAPKKRTRRSRNTVNLQTEMPVGYIDSHGTITMPVVTNATISVPPATANEPEQGTSGNGKVSTPALAEPSQPVVITPASTSMTMATAAPTAIQVVSVSQAPILSPEKTKEYRDRLNKYSSVILAGAGMMPVDGVGGVTMQLRLFSTRHLGVPDSTKLTEAQFEDLLGFLDDYVKSNGAQALVEYIQKSIGVA
jgi:hypothetical protein